MKLNYRDAVILGALLAVVILIAGFVGLVKPKNQDIKDDTALLETKESERAEVEDRIAQIEPLKKEITQIHDDTNAITANFVKPEEIMDAKLFDQYMQHFEEECDVKVKTLSAGELSTSTISFYYFTPSIVGEDLIAAADLNGEIQAEIDKEFEESNAVSQRNPQETFSAQYGISVTGKKENIWKYMQTIEEQDKTIIINSLTLPQIFEKDSDGKEFDESQDIDVTFVVTVYSLYDLADPDLEPDD